MMRFPVIAMTIFYFIFGSTIVKLNRLNEHALKKQVLILKFYCIFF